MHSRKWFRSLAPAVAICCTVALATGAVPSVRAEGTAADEDVTLIRVFLKDGTSLVSYGEPARITDHVVFSMPTSAGPSPPLRLVTIPLNRVDWDRTDKYAASARAHRYLKTQAEPDYAALSNQITETLNEVTVAADPARRLALVERARKTLSEWPATHYNYRQAEVQQMLALLDEAIADLRAANGVDRFSLNVTAFGEPPVSAEPLLPGPSGREAIEQMLTAARIVDSASEREALLDTALHELDRSASELPAEWVAATRQSTQSALEEERRVDHAYQTLSKDVLMVAARRARLADVRGVESLTARVREGDRVLGNQRPQTITSLVAALQEQLDGARHLRLARDRWALREPAYRAYRVAMAGPLRQFLAMTPSLESIKSLAGSSPTALAVIEQSVTDILTKAALIAPPDELKSAHALLISAVQLARNAAAIRREAVLGDSMARAWDASSAAAGALLLGTQARDDMQAIVRPPQLR